MMRLAVVLAATLAAAACGSDETTPSADAGALTGDSTRGMTLYGAKACATCHGNDGKMNPPGTTTPITSALIQAKTDADLSSSIKNGKGTMPALPDLTAQELADLVAYVRKLPTL